MKIVSMSDYYKAISEFFAKHEIDVCYTSKMENNHYVKHYICKDNAELWEDNSIVIETINEEIHGIKCSAKVELWKSECWSTEWPSMYLYQKA